MTTMLSKDDKGVYLGDGLFARFDGYQIELYASNGIYATNTVYLEPSVLQSFVNYVRTLPNGAAFLEAKL